MNWQLLVTTSAKKELAKLPNQDQVRLERALDALQDDPFSGDIKRLQPPEWRRRVGNYPDFLSPRYREAADCNHRRKTPHFYNVLNPPPPVLKRLIEYLWGMA